MNRHNPFIPSGIEPLSIPWEPINDGGILEFGLADPDTSGLRETAFKIDHRIELYDTGEAGTKEGTLDYYGTVLGDEVRGKLGIEVSLGSPKRSRLWIHVNDVEEYCGSTNRVVDEWVHAGTVHQISAVDANRSS